MTDVGTIVEVDWNNNGLFSDANEDVSVDVQWLHWERGRNNELERAISGQCEFYLRNDTGKYSPDNSSSPLSGNLKPGRKVQVRTTSPIVKTHFTGYIEDIIPDPDPENLRCYIRAVDGAAQVLATKSVRSIIFTDKGAGSAVDDSLDRVNWSATARILDTGQTTFPQWWSHDEYALDAIHKVEEAERGFFYIDGQGNAVYEDRHHRLKGAHLTSQASLTAADIIKMNYQSRLRELKNEITIKVYRAVAGSAGSELWRLRQIVYLPAATRSILVMGQSSATTATAVFLASYSNPATSVITPVATTDYTANQAIDGTGTDITSQLTVSLVTSFAQGAAIAVTNGGPKGGYLTLLKIRGTLQERPDPLIIMQGDTTSQTEHGRRTLEIDNNLVQDANEAQDYADYLVGQLKDPQPYIEIQVPNTTSTLTNFILQRDLSDRITITEGNTGVNGPYFIERGEWTVEETDWLVKFLLRKADLLTYWILDDTTYSVLDSTTRLAY